MSAPAKSKVGYWVMKSEPGEYSIDDLGRDGVIGWTGIRNYQVRNMIRDKIKVGDVALFYHSNSKEIGIVGEMKVCREAYPDPTQFDSKDPHFDVKATVAKPRWFSVDVKFANKFKKIVTLANLKNDSTFNELSLIEKGNRLSITEIEKKHFEQINRIANF